ncbi:hypothetical protein BJX61DRAFT_153894 [Aspergillus egyptiacus]|nr:hypothetical protein BJX61DRAFT_153894 [Aspergillus egyptiacus]
MSRHNGCGASHARTAPPQLVDAVKTFQHKKVRALLKEEKLPLGRTVIELAAVEYYNQKVFEVIATCLAERRRELLELARGAMTSPIFLEACGIRQETDILDSQAAAVADALHISKVIDCAKHAYFDPDFPWASCATSLYFLVSCNKQAAQILYDVGFRNVDEADQLGNSPVSALKIPKPGLDVYQGEWMVSHAINATMRYLAMCQWFRDRGASLYRVFGVSQGTPMHHIAFHVGRCFGWLLRDAYDEQTCGGSKSAECSISAMSERLMPFNKGYSPFLRQILDASHCDLYSCVCAVGGCRPANLIYNEVLSEMHTPTTVHIFMETFVRILEPEDEVAALAFYKNQAPMFLRACTFACLKLQHTCVSAGKKSGIQLLTDKNYRKGRLEELLSEVVDWIVDRKELQDMPPPECWTWWRARLARALEQFGITLSE